MNNLSPAECIEICKLINPNLTWVWNDHFNMDDPPFYAINGTGNLDELYMVKIYYKNENIVLIDGNSENMDENIINFQSNNKILQILGDKGVEKISSSKDDTSKLVLKKYIEKKSDKFSTTVEYRMKESAILDNNEGLPYTYKIDLNVRVFVENNDFLNSKIILALTYYAPEPGTGTILHESVADVMIDNKDIFKLDNEYSYSGLDYYGASGNKLEICNEKLAEKSSRIEQIQFYIDLATLIKIINAEKFEIRFNKKWEYGGRLLTSEIFKLIGLYNALFDKSFKINEIINQVKKGNHVINNSNKKLDKIQHDNKKSVAQIIKSKNESNNKTNSNCFIITATMNDPCHPIVDEFRAYRDSKLLTNIVGKAFVSCYYKVGPYAALLISKSLLLRKLSFSFFVNPVYKVIKNDRRKK